MLLWRYLSLALSWKNVLPHFSIPYLFKLPHFKLIPLLKFIIIILIINTSSASHWFVLFYRTFKTLPSPNRVLWKEFCRIMQVTVWLWLLLPLTDSCKRIILYNILVLFFKYLWWIMPVLLWLCDKVDRLSCLWTQDLLASYKKSDFFLNFIVREYNSKNR